MISIDKSNSYIEINFIGTTVDHSLCTVLRLYQGKTFRKVRTRQGGLLSFNNFLSTSLDKNVSLGFLFSLGEPVDMEKVLIHHSSQTWYERSSIRWCTRIQLLPRRGRNPLFDEHSFSHWRTMSQGWVYRDQLDNDERRRSSIDPCFMHRSTTKSSGDSLTDSLTQLLLTMGQASLADTFHSTSNIDTESVAPRSRYNTLRGIIKTQGIQGSYVEAARYFRLALFHLSQILNRKSSWFGIVIQQHRFGI